MENLDARILVVEPDPAIRALLLAILRRGGLAADCAADHDGAVHLAAKQRYAAAIIEPRMAGGDLLLSSLAAGGDERPSIIIATTPDATSARLARRPGVVAVLAKPFRVDELFEVVAACCGVDGEP